MGQFVCLFIISYNSCHYSFDHYFSFVHLWFIPPTYNAWMKLVVTFSSIRIQISKMVSEMTSNRTSELTKQNSTNKIIIIFSFMLARCALSVLCGWHMTWHPTPDKTYNMRSDMTSDIWSDMTSNVPSDIEFDMTSDMKSDMTKQKSNAYVHCGVLSGFFSSCI